MHDIEVLYLTCYFVPVSPGFSQVLEEVLNIYIVIEVLCEKPSDSLILTLYLIL